MIGLAEAVVKGGVVVLVATGAISDLRTRRIPNALTFGGAVTGLLVNVAFFRQAGVSASLAGWALATGLLIIPFFTRGLGGGDVKLLAAVGAWGGPQFVLAVLLYAALAGGIMAIGALIVQGRAADLALRLAGWVSFQVSWLLVAIWPRAVVPVLNVAGGTASGTERGPTRLPYGPAIAIGGIVAILLGGG